MYLNKIINILNKFDIKKGDANYFMKIFTGIIKCIDFIKQGETKKTLNDKLNINII